MGAMSAMRQFERAVGSCAKWQRPSLMEAMSVKRVRRSLSVPARLVGATALGTAHSSLIDSTLRAQSLAAEAQRAAPQVECYEREAAPSRRKARASSSVIEMVGRCALCIANARLSSTRGSFARTGESAEPAVGGAWKRSREELKKRRRGSVSPSRRVAGCAGGVGPSRRVAGCAGGVGPSRGVAGCAAGVGPSRRVTGCAGGEAAEGARGAADGAASLI